MQTCDTKQIRCPQVNLSIEIINNKARHNLIDAKCRWRSERLDGAGSFWEPAWLNESDANLPEGDTNPPGGDNT